MFKDELGTLYYSSSFLFSISLLQVAYYVSSYGRFFVWLACFILHFFFSLFVSYLPHLHSYSSPIIHCFVSVSFRTSFAPSIPHSRCSLEWRDSRVHPSNTHPPIHSHPPYFTFRMVSFSFSSALLLSLFLFSCAGSARSAGKVNSTHVTCFSSM